MLSEAFRVLSGELRDLGNCVLIIGVGIAGLKDTLPSSWEGKVIYGGAFFLASSFVAHLIGVATA